MDTTMVKKYSDAMDEVNSWLLNEAMDNMIESIHSKVSENEFDHLKNKLSDPEEDAGKCCKKYVECAEKCGRLEEAKTEIQRLLKIGVNSARIDMSNKEVRKVAENIVAQYTSTKTQTQQLPNDDEIKKLLGEKVCNFITKLQSAKSEEEAVKLIESADDDDLNVNLKDLFMTMITSTAGGNAAESTGSTAAAKSQQQPKGKQTKQASNQKKKDTPNTKQQKKPTPAPSTNTTEPDIAQMILQAEPGQKLFTTTSVPQPQTV